METTTIVLLLVQFLVAGSCFYLLMCADPNSPGILGKLHRFIYKFIPSLYNKKKSEAGEKQNICFRIVDGIFNYLCYTNHPIIQIFYVIVAGGGFVVYWYYGFQRNFPNSQVGSFHIHLGSIFMFFCFYSYYLACKVSPGKITKENVKNKLKKFDKFYDDVLFEKNNKCTTCEILKPARSKHCKTCNMCVSRFDHHCIWIRQCVGEKNYKYFLLFIASHAIVTIYGGVLGLFCLYGIVVDNNLLKAQFRIPGTEEISDATWSIIIKYIFYKETMYVFIIVLCVVMGLTLTVFLFYHFSMIKDNMTTNERIKRSDFLDFFEKEIEKIKKNIELKSAPNQDNKQQNKEKASNETNEVEEKAEDRQKIIAELQVKLKKYKRDQETLKKWFPKKGFVENLKQIMSA